MSHEKKRRLRWPKSDNDVIAAGPHAFATLEEALTLAPVIQSEVVLRIWPARAPGAAHGVSEGALPAGDKATHARARLH